MRATYPDKSQTAGTTGLTTHKHDGASVQTDFAECRHSQAIVPRQTTGPNHTNVARNSIGRRFNEASKRCNSNAANPWFEIVAGELHAKLAKKTQKARGRGLAVHRIATTVCLISTRPGFATRRQCGGRRRGRGAWPGFEPTRRAKLAARTAGERARRHPEHRWRSQQEHRWRSQQ